MLRIYIILLFLMIINLKQLGPNKRFTPQNLKRQLQTECVTIILTHPNRVAPQKQDLLTAPTSHGTSPKVFLPVSHLYKIVMQTEFIDFGSPNISNFQVYEFMISLFIMIL